jgi:hypothetical protein
VAARPFDVGSELGGASSASETTHVRRCACWAWVHESSTWARGELRLGMDAREQGERERRNGDGANTSARVRQFSGSEAMPHISQNICRQRSALLTCEANT